MRIHRITFAALIVGVTVVSLGIAAMYTGPITLSNLSLDSGYSSDGTTGGLEARSIHLDLDRNEHGWSGWMTLDPNRQTFNELGHLTETTLMAGERVAIVLSLFGAEENPGRTCYEVVQNRFDQKMFLVFPSHSGGTYRLVIRGDGPTTTNVVFLEEERSDEVNARSPGKHE